MPPSKRSTRRVLFALLAIAAIAFAIVQLAGEWRAFRASGLSLQLRWPHIVASGMLTLASYAILIETWRRTVRAWGSHISWPDAARIWFVSNLGRYLPGKFWQIGAMGVMAHERGVPAIAATGSAVVVNLVNLIAGFAIVAVTGAQVLTENRGATLATLALALALLAAAPFLVHVGASLLGRLLNRPVEVPRLPYSVVWIAGVGCTAAWILYGLAFRLLTLGVLGQATGNVAGSIAAFTGSYLLGYIAVFAPGGVGVREPALVTSMELLGLAEGGGAGVMAIASRLWLTVLEVVPGVLLLVIGAMRSRRPSTTNHVTHS